MNLRSVGNALSSQLKRGIIRSETKGRKNIYFIKVPDYAKNAPRSETDRGAEKP